MQTVLTWGLAGACVLIVALAVALGINSSRLDAARATIAARDATIELCNGTNTTNLTTIAELQAAAKANAKALQAAKITGDMLLARLDSVREAAAAAEAREEQLRRTIYAEDPDCARWGDQPVCPAIARRLLERQAARSH